MTRASHLHRSPDDACGRRCALPHRLRLLFVGPTEPPWALLAMRLEAAGCDQAEFDWQSRPADALARLRGTAFDCILLSDDLADPLRTTHVDLVEGLRASGGDDPVVVLMSQPDDERAVRYFELDCELLVTKAGWQSQALADTIRRAVVRGDLSRDLAGLEQAAIRGRARERDEAKSHLHELQGILGPLHQPFNAATPPRHHTDVQPPIAAKISEYYRELLRTYVMMGCGHLAGEVFRLAQVLSLTGISPHRTLALHVEQVECLLRGLGRRSSRHVMSRADLLALELLTHLGECYRTKAPSRGLGDSGVDLLHAESLLHPSASIGHAG